MLWGETAGLIWLWSLRAFVSEATPKGPSCFPTEGVTCRNGATKLRVFVAVVPGPVELGPVSGGRPAGQVAGIPGSQRPCRRPGGSLRLFFVIATWLWFCYPSMACTQKWRLFAKEAPGYKDSGATGFLLKGR